MKRYLVSILVIVMIFFTGKVYSQNKDKAAFIVNKPGFNQNYLHLNNN